MPKPLALFRPAVGRQARCACWAALAAGLALLSACNSQPAATTASQPALPALAPPPTPAGDTATTVTLTPQDTLLMAGATPGTGDVPALHKPFADTKTVGPGLQVIVSSVPLPITAAGPEPGELMGQVLTIQRRGQVIFRDTTADYLAYVGYSEVLTSRLYPLWLPTGPGAGQLLVAYSNRPQKDRVRRFYLQGSRVVRLDTLPTFDGPARDLDQDGRPEYGGIDDYGDGLADDHGRPRTPYNPVLYYEVRPGAGLVFDSVLTRRRAVARYGTFHGFGYSTRYTFPAGK